MYQKTHQNSLKQNKSPNVFRLLFIDFKKIGGGGGKEEREEKDKLFQDTVVIENIKTKKKCIIAIEKY